MSKIVGTFSISWTILSDERHKNSRSNA